MTLMVTSVFADVIELKNGKKLLIGTQKESDTKRILETYKTKL